MLMVGLFTLAACGRETENPVVKEGKAFPKCPYTEVVYNSQQLIDITVDDLIKRIPRCGQIYSSVRQFYSRNPHCCDIDLTKTYQGDRITDRRLSGLGYLIGGVRMHFYCASSKNYLGEYTMGLANVTSCGKLAEPTVVPYESKFVGRYPKK
jgi:hypothetical protein